MKRAQARIRAELQRLGGGPTTAGSTVAGAVLTAHEAEPYWLVFNVGDSRVYRLVAGSLSQVSVDHSVVQEMIDSGTLSRQDARESRHRHVITRAVDSGPDTRADFWLLSASGQDRLLMCSDGLLDELSEEHIAGVLREQELASAAAETLLQDAIAHGARDNVSVVVVDLVGAADLAHTAPRAEPGGQDTSSLGTTVPREQIRTTEG